MSLFMVLHAGAKELPVHCSDDIARADSIISVLKSSGVSTGERMAMAAEALQGAGLDDYYRTDSVGALRINLHSFTPIMFLNTVMALTKASEEPGMADTSAFSRQFESVASRRGENTGYPSIMYHSSDWIGDNIARGNVVELTEDYSGVIARTKSLDEMTRRRQDYAALADSATFEAVRMTEMGFRTHRVPTLKKETIKKKELIDDLADGDIIILVPSRDGVDYWDIGIVKKENGLPFLVHLSPMLKTVIKEKEDLARYMSLVTKHFQGYRILRIKE